jgi:hypothetical protein
MGGKLEDHHPIDCLFHPWRLLLRAIVKEGAEAKANNRG